MELNEHPFILSISPEKRPGVVEALEIKELAPEAHVFEENSTPDALFLLLGGAVRFAKTRPDGTPQIINEATPGGFFGEVGVFTGEPRALSAAAGPEGAVVARMPETTVRSVIADSEPARKILESVVRHLRNTTTHYMDEIMRTEKLTLVGTMVSSILHDFKNPFSIISLGAYLIQKRHGDDPKVVKICGDIESQIRRMVEMANDLAAFARGERRIEIAHVAMEDLFARFRELNAPFFEDPSVEIITEANNVTLEADRAKLLRVLQNLVSNAIEALHIAGRPGRVWLAGTREDDHIRLEIGDNGPGIPESIRDTFFEPFTTEGKKEGTGLGSAIVKSIIEAHRGTVEFTTSAEGTVFTIRLPEKSPVEN